MRADVDLDIGRRTFASGVLPELIAVLRRCRPGDLVAVVGDEESIGADLETWCRFTGNPLLEATVEKGHSRWVFRCGAAPVSADDNRPVGSRLWLYTNFHCNLHCDYCCVRSSPAAPRREPGLVRVQQIAREAAELGVKEIFVTGGEPFLLRNISEILASCAAAAPTTVLTNGMLFAGRRAEALRALPRDRIVLQISLDSATPELHDLHRGPGLNGKTLNQPSPSGEPVVDDTFLLLLNSSENPIDFTLPRVNGSGCWKVMVDTNNPKLEGEHCKHTGEKLNVADRSMMLLREVRK